MKKESWKILGLILLSVILISLIANFVAAQWMDPVRDMFANWTEGQLSTNIAKYLFLAMLTILLFSILDLIPTVKKLNWMLKLILAGIIGFLSIAYLTPSEVYAMLASYSALGFVICAGFPFIILIFFTIDITRKGGVGARIFAKIMWFAFIAFLVYKLIAGWVDPTNPLQPGMALAYLIAIGLAILYVTIFNTAILKMWFKEEIETYQQRHNQNLKKQETKLHSEVASVDRELSYEGPAEEG